MKEQLKFLFVIAIYILTIPSIFAQSKEAPTVESTAVKLSDNALKVRPFSPVVGHMGISYEFLVADRQSFELDLGYIGLGQPYEEDAEEKGIYLGFGCRFIRHSGNSKKKDQVNQPLQGWYLNPKLILSSFSRRDRERSYLEESIFSGAILLNGGQQWIFFNRVVLDIFAGAGLGLSSYDDYFFGRYFYGYSLIGKHFAISTGIKLGIAF
ncbi:MAG: hypothetical protein AAF990_12555 [Bacteroidota bacterium]